LLGALLSNSKDFKNAENELKRSVDLDKDNADAVLKLGQVQAASGASDQAITTYQNFIQNNPRDVRFYIVLGQLYESVSNWDKAKDMYEKALQVQPDNPMASNNLAYVMLQQGGNVDVALSMAQNARRRAPNDPNFADTLGWAYYKKGAFASAADLFKEAIKLNKDNSTDDAEFHYHLGLAYQKTDQPALAKQQFERVLKINPGFSNADDVRKLLAELR
jgi:tetratricopeptide (TPR) repeat protein